MGYRMDLKDADRMFAKLQEEYEIWAPKRFVGKGRYSDTDLIKYARVDRAEEIEYREKSDFPLPSLCSISQRMNSLKARPVPRSCLYSCGPAISTRSITRKKFI